MKIVIDIPDICYDWIKNGFPDNADKEFVISAIRSGTVLPKGCGGINMTRLIDADELKKCAIPCEIHNGALTDMCVPLYQINNAPTVEININDIEYKAYCKGLKDGKKIARPQGEWYYNCQDGWHCSICHEIVKDMPTVMRKANFDFCPHCGADMRGGAE